jgi:hypothetical protein
MASAAWCRQQAEVLSRRARERHPHAWMKRFWATNLIAEACASREDVQDVIKPETSRYHRRKDPAAR